MNPWTAGVPKLNTTTSGAGTSAVTVEDRVNDINFRDLHPAMPAAQFAYTIIPKHAALVAAFGQDESSSDELRFPLFLWSITGNAVAILKKLRARVPATPSYCCNSCN